MRSLSVRLLLSFLALILTPALFAHDVTISGTTSFASLDGSSSDHDGSANGVFTVNDGNLVINGTVNCNDDSGGGNASACAMSFYVSGNLTMNAGSALYAENRQGGGHGGAITLTVGGNVSLLGNAVISSASRTTGGGAGGAISADVGGSVSLGAGSTFDSGASNGAAGAIDISAGGVVTVDGNVLAGPSRTILSTRLGPGAALDGGTSNSAGGAITIATTTFVEPALIVGSTANIVSQGASNAAGPVTIDGCGVQIKGLVAALSRNSTASSVSVRSGKDILVDGRDLGGAGTRMGRIRADAVSGSAANRGIDLFASETIDIHGASMYVLSSNSDASHSAGGTIRVIALGDGVNASGNVADAGGTLSGTNGGTIDIASKEDANLNTAALRATGDATTNNNNRGGGTIRVRSYSADVIWTNGTGDVRPVGSASNLPASAQGEVILTACGTVNTSGSSFPVNGAATSPLPQIQTGVCSPAAPSLPSGAPPLVTCNTPPVANDASATTNEDTTVTITLSGSDADGDSLTFSIVSGPANGVLGAIIQTGPTTATVDYTPNLNYNGADSFVYQANDGNGGTDNATVNITINAVNDPPVFTIGSPVSVFEDSGTSTFSNWVTGISPGPADESGQSVAFTVTNDNPSLFLVPPTITSSGTLAFTVAANQYGVATISVVAQDNGGTANGGDDTSNAQTQTITVVGVNDEPSFVGGGNVSVNEDSGAYSAAWASSISAGSNEGGQTVSFVTANNNNALFQTQPAIDNAGNLSFTPAANANGSATVTVYAQDDGGTANGGDNTSPSQTFTITVVAVNDEPSFTSGGDVTVNEDSGAYSAAWATSISAGPADESGQTVTFFTSNNNNSLFMQQPAINAAGVLTFTPSANAYGSATVSVYAQDNGGTLNGGDDTSPAQTFTITVNAVNDEPSFTSGGNVTVNEDSGAYSAAWATAISAGPNESGQTITFFASNNNNALFQQQPAISSSGVLTFTPAANANGTATVTVYAQDDGGTSNGGDDTSPAQTFTITVNAVNDEPSFTSGGNVTVNEDSGAYSAQWATSISAGPADEAGQAVTFNITGNTNPSLFATGPTISSTGVLSFTLVADAYGTSTITVTLSDDGGTANGGDDTSAPQSFDIIVNNVNDEPTFVSGGNVTVNEDSGAYSAPWASAISAGPNEGGQTVTFFTSNDNNGLFLVQPAINSSGTLSFTPNPNEYGVATVTVYAQDNGGTANGGDDTSATYTFTITINAVNDAPSFTSGGNVTVNEDSGAYSASWATSISAGPANESSQTVSFVITGNTNPSLFAIAPSVSSSGVLTFTLNSNVSGSSTITLHAQDNGGTANGGVDTSASASFIITVNGVNDAPSFTAGGNVTVNEDSGAYSATWATSISAGPPDESGQTVTFFTSNNNNALFQQQPTINSSGVLSFTPALNAFGSATVSVYAQDNGGTANGGVDTSATSTFTITVNAVNDPPTAGNDAWDTIGNTELRVDHGTTSTPHVVDTTPSGTGVLHNDADNVEGDPFSITGVVGCADTTAPFVCTVTGGTLTLEANGSFIFQPSPGAVSGGFQYIVTDQPSAGTPASATGTVTLNIYEMVWYVNGLAAAGNGTSSSPFNSLAPLGGADPDDANDYIFVHNSVVSGSIALEQGQRFWGEGIGLSIPVNLNGNGSPTVLVAAGTSPTINGGGADVVDVTGVTGTEIAGLNLNSGAQSGISVTTLSGGFAASATIYNNSIVANTDGIDINAASTNGLTVTINNTNIVSVGNGVDVTGSGNANVAYTNGTITATSGIGFNAVSTAPGLFRITGLSDVTINGLTGGAGIVISGATFDGDPSNATIQTVNGGTINVGIAGNPVGGAAITMTNVSGDYAITTTNAYGTSGVIVAGTGLYTGSTGMRISNSSGGTITGSAGVGLSVTNATIGSANLTFTSVSSSAGANGIVLNNTGTSGGLTVNGTGAAGSGGTIQTATGDGVSLTSTERVTLKYMNITGNLGSGIRGTTVNGFVLDNSSVTSNGDSAAADESGINISELTGTSAPGTHPTRIANSTISNNHEFEVQIVNTTGTLAEFLMNNVAVSSNGASGAHGNLVNFLGLGTASMTLNVSGGSYTGNAPSTATGIHADTGGGTMVANIGSASFTNNNVGVNVSTSSSGSITFDVHDNVLNGSRSHALNLFLNASTTGSASGKFRNNVIGTNGTAGSGSLLGIGVRVQNEALANATVLIDGNNMAEFANFAAITVNHGVVSSPLSLNTNATITGNTIRNVNASRAIIVQQNVGKGTVCADISGNDMSGIAGSGGDGTKIRIRQLAGGTFNVRQKQATAAADPLELDDANSVGANTTTAAEISASGTFNYNSGGCPQP